MTFDPGDFRMGQPSRLKACYPSYDGGERGELKHLDYPQEEKITMIPLVVVSERGKAQTARVSGTVVVGLRHRKKHDEWKDLERFPVDGERPVHEVMRSVAAP